MDNSQITLTTKPEPNNLADGYLKFYLNRQTTAVVAMGHTQEAVVVPVESVTSMPGMSPCILGLMNWRSRIIWTIDLPRMLNLESVEMRSRQYNVIVIRVDTLIFGLVVDEIVGTTRFLVDEIVSPIGQVASSLVPYLRGCVAKESETILVLDAQAIVNSAALRNES
jgi:positive phototaxis protein PixI